MGKIGLIAGAVALGSAVLSANFAQAGDRARDDRSFRALAKASCADLTKGHPAAPVAFAAGYIVGLMYDGDVAKDHMDELLDYCRERPSTNLAALIVGLKLQMIHKTSEDIIVSPDGRHHE